MLDLQEGFYTAEAPLHFYYIENSLAQITAQILNTQSIHELKTIKLNQTIRRQLLEFYIQYFALHITNFTTLRSVEVLKEVLE